MWANLGSEADHISTSVIRSYPCKMRKEHPSVPLTLPRGSTMEVDAKLAPLISSLLTAGFRVEYFSVGAQRNPQGKKGQIRGHEAHIMFRSPLEAAIFVSLAGPASWNEDTTTQAREEAQRIALDWARRRHELDSEGQYKSA
jgi:hypothetical protein